MQNYLEAEALKYHQYPQPGKTTVLPTKPYVTQQDLSLAYSPGVAFPCLEIEKNPSDALPPYPTVAILSEWFPTERQCSVWVISEHLRGNR